MAFENTKQFRLAFKRHLSNFIKKQRAAVGLFKPPYMFLVGSRKGPFDMPKELAFHKLRGDRGAIDTEHRSVSTDAGPMDGSGNQFFA